MFHLGRKMSKKKTKMLSQLTSFLTTAPRKAREVEESLEEVEQGPCDDDDVVDVLQEHHHDGRVAHAFEDWCQLAHDRHAPNTKVLANGDLEEKEGDATDSHREEVGDEEGA